MRSILHTERKWVAGVCYIVFLFLTLMLVTAMFFLIVDLWIGKDVRSVRIYGSMIWIYFWMRMYYLWVKRCTTWWTLLGDK